MKLGAAGRWRCSVGWEQPRQRRNGSAPPDGPGPASETERCTTQEPVVEPLKWNAGSNLVDQGR
jgi:hypothetical protein